MIAFLGASLSWKQDWSSRLDSRTAHMSRLRLSSRHFRGALKQGRGLYAEGGCEFFDHCNGGAVSAALKCTDVCPIDPSFVRQGFLRQALLLPVSPKVASEHLS
jgi:hypothetical protein